MKIIVTHTSPDLDAITSVWLIRRFLPNWQGAVVEFVPAGNRSQRIKNPDLTKSIEAQGKDEITHVDTGLGPLDHHQTDDLNVCGASRVWDYIKSEISNRKSQIANPEENRHSAKTEALDRIVKIVVDYDHFREVFWENPTADYYEFSLYGILEGLKIQKPDEDDYYVEYISSSLDAILHNFENRIWAEKEIADNGIIFDTKKGKGVALESLNDTVIKLSQKMGYVVVVRKDPRKGYVRIKAMPFLKSQSEEINLTLVYERLKKMDPEASWFLHVSKKMLLNGSAKNPDMRPSSLSLSDIIKVVKENI